MAAPVHAACVIAPNYLPHARVLAESFGHHHPDGRLSVLLVGGPPVAVAGADVLTPADIGIGEAELHRRGVLFDEQGVISSLRPALLGHLLDAGAEAVLLLDADMLVLGALDDEWRLARDAGVLLSPHALTPLGGRPGAWREEELLRSGAYSGGFVGVGAAGRGFLDWLAARAARDCLRAPERGLLYTQTWLTLVPALFPCHVLRDPAINVQIHSLGGRDVDGDIGAPVLGDVPVRLFHFAGFDPARPDRLCRYYDDDEATLDTRPGLAQLCGEYRDRLARAGWPVSAAWPWAVTAAGVPVDTAIRRAYREAILAAERGEAPQPPDPFNAAEAEAALRWLRTPPAGTSVTRYLLGLHAERDDLRAVFPRVPGADEQPYLRWAAEKLGLARSGGRAELPASMAPVSMGFAESII